MSFTGARVPAFSSNVTVFHKKCPHQRIGVRLPPSAPGKGDGMAHEKNRVSIGLKSLGKIVGHYFCNKGGKLASPTVSIAFPGATQGHKIVLSEIAGC